MLSYLEILHHDEDQDVSNDPSMIPDVGLERLHPFLFYFCRKDVSQCLTIH